MNLRDYNTGTRLAFGFGSMLPILVAQAASGDWVHPERKLGRH